MLRADSTTYLPLDLLKIRTAIELIADDVALLSGKYELAIIAKRWPTAIIPFKQLVTW